ncbi:MAG: PLP-dependent aminotransferase family protein [candidate division Zixibacteria bacterium]|nr:PLP-dependent aminotransferase family protein [candidate division Zixibacteria bacterium]
MTLPEKWGVVSHVLTLENSIIREILKLSSQPGVISFAGGLPAPELFPLEDLKEASVRAIDKHGPIALQYSLSMGVTEFRKAVAEVTRHQIPDVKMENILITSGSQQGLDLVGRAFIDPGDYVVCESPTYTGALQAFNFYQARYMTVGMDDDGMIVDEVEAAIKKRRPKFIYVIPNFHNPTGITMSLKRRLQLIELANKYELPSIDDNPYGDLRFEGDPVPSLRALGGDTVISLMTFSKIVTPGLRIAWLVSPEGMMPIFERVKQSCDLHTSTFGQMVLLEYLKMGKLDQHIEKIRRTYSARRDIMVNAIAEYFPSGTKVVKPKGGLFLWLTLPNKMSAKDLLPKAIAAKVAYVYGSPFHPNGGGEDTMRLNFSTANEKDILEGIKRLGRIVTENM